MDVDELTPMLTVRDARAASDFYQRAFAAKELARAASPSGQYVIELAIGRQRFFAVDENPAAHNTSPDALGGTSVRLSLVTDDPDAAAQRAVEAGARLVFPVDDQPYGMRQGRIADPFGHHWLLGKYLALPAATAGQDPKNASHD